MMRYVTLGAVILAVLAVTQPAIAQEGGGNVHIARTVEANSLITGSMLVDTATVEGSIVINGDMKAQNIESVSIAADIVRVVSLKSPTGTILVDGDLVITNSRPKRGGESARMNGNAPANQATGVKSSPPVLESVSGTTAPANTSPNGTGGSSAAVASGSAAASAASSGQASQQSGGSAAASGSAAVASGTPAPSASGSPSASAASASQQQPAASGQQQASASSGAQQSGSASASTPTAPANIQSVVTPIRAVAFLAEDIVIGGVKQWKLVRHEDFENGAHGWSLLETSSCAGKNFFLGGHCNLGHGQVSKKFAQLPPHDHVRVTGRYHFIDNWQGETAFLKVDEQYAWTDKADSRRSVGVDMCGNAQYPETRMSVPVDVTIPHTASFLELSFGSTTGNAAAEDPCNRSFGVDDLMIYVK